MADDRTYIKVHDGIEDHPKIVALSDAAFRLLVTTWGWCSRHHTDGRVPLTVWRRRGTAKARKELVDGQLAEQHDGHLQMHDYLEHQRSAAEIAAKKEEKRAAGMKGAHKRWHTGPDKADPACPDCVAEGWHLPSATHGKSHSKPMAETETETETDNPLVTWGGDLAKAPRDDPRPQRPPERCPKHLDVEQPPPCGNCADARRAAERFDEQQQQRKAAIAEYLEQARADPRNRCEHGTDGGTVMHPETGKPLCALCRAAAAS